MRPFVATRTKWVLPPRPVLIKNFPVRATATSCRLPHGTDAAESIVGCLETAVRRLMWRHQQPQPSVSPATLGRRAPDRERRAADPVARPIGGSPTVKVAVVVRSIRPTDGASRLMAAGGG